MDLAAVGQISTQMHMAQTQQAVGVSLTKKVMDTQETQAAALIESLEAAVPTQSFGHKLDVLA